VSAEPVEAPEPGWPDGALYHSPRGLYGFQEDGIARAYLKLEQGGGVMAVWDTGTGKSHLAMALSAFMFEDDKIDHVLLVAEKGKITADEWPSDFAKFTRLSAAVHHGTGRMKRLEKNGLPQVLITTYETGKADLSKVVRVPGKRGKSLADGPLMEMFKGKRVLVVYDESTKVKNRESDNYKSWFRSLGAMRKGEVTRVLEMTATPIERDYEDAYSQLRLADPKSMPLVKEFEWFVRSRDPYGRPHYYKDRMPRFAEIAKPMILRVRKSDPEVMAEFPKQVEESRWFTMADDQRDLYEMVCDLQEPGAEPVPGLHTIKRMVANHPESIIHSAKHGSSRLARMLVEELGEDYFRSVSAVKEQGLIDYLEPVVHGQGAKAVVFSFFGPSVLPLLARALRKKKFEVYLTWGGMSLEETSIERAKFKSSPNPAVLLSSDAGARGVNLPQATYVVEYESALTFANRTQRINRTHRIDSEAESTTCMTFFVHQTVEETVANAMIERNAQQDTLLDDTDSGEDFITAAERRQMLQIARNPRKRARA
jgi:SNF2 family DNA or RNA helicase